MRIPRRKTVRRKTTRRFEGAIIIILAGITLVIGDSAVLAMTLTDYAVLNLTLADTLAGG